MGSKDYGFCLVCLESIMPFEPRSVDGKRHEQCDNATAFFLPPNVLFEGIGFSVTYDPNTDRARVEAWERDFYKSVSFEAFSTRLNADSRWAEMAVFQLLGDFALAGQNAAPVIRLAESLGSPSKLIRARMCDIAGHHSRGLPT
jgi:hypothetical protein